MFTYVYLVVVVLSWVSLSMVGLLGGHVRIGVFACCFNGLCLKFGLFVL